jgi:Xaa-Pro aminopeptidase
MKAVKNPVEVEGMKTAHIKDAAAITRFFTWMEGALLRGEELSELSCVDKLLEFRK